MVIDEPRLPGVLAPQVYHPTAFCRRESNHARQLELTAAYHRPVRHERGVRNARHVDLSRIRSPLLSGSSSPLLSGSRQWHGSLSGGVIGTPSRRMTSAGW